MKDVLQDINLLCLIKEDPARKGFTWTVFLNAADIAEAARKLLAAEFHLEDITGLDVREGFVVLYSFDRSDRPERVSLRVLLPHAAPDIPSIAGIYQGAEWHEREAADFYGIRFAGNPNPTRLLLPPDMNDFPLRRKDAERASLRAIFTPVSGVYIHKNPAFTLLDEESAAEAAAEGKSSPAAKNKAAESAPSKES